MIRQQRFLAFAIVVSLIAFVLGSGCEKEENPNNFLGLSFEDAKRRHPGDGYVIYSRRGVKQPYLYSGQIVLSPYTIRQPLRERLTASYVTCKVVSGEITTCTPVTVDGRRSELLAWLVGRELASIPLEFYMEAPDDEVVGWIDVDRFRKPTDSFAGVVLFHGSKHLYFLRFYDGICVGVDIEGNW